MSLWDAIFGEPVETTPDWYARERSMMAAQNLQNDPRYVSESERRMRALEARVAELERRLGDCGHPWVEPDTGRCLGCGTTLAKLAGLDPSTGLPDGSLQLNRKP